MSLSPAEQAKRWKTHSGTSERLVATHAALDTIIRQRFPRAEDTFDYNMRGWAIRRPVDITEWTGTIDPNYVRIYIAERKNGITIHIWNPYVASTLERPEIVDAGFKPMVGCLQWNRKGDVPTAALQPLLDDLKTSFDEEA